MTTHHTIQTQLLEGARTSEVDDHLGGCEECLRLDAALTAIRHNAPQVGGGAPAGLADRVIERVRAEIPTPTHDTPRTGAASTAAVGAGATARRSPEWVRRSAYRSLAMAAALLVLVGAVAVLNHGGEEEPLDVLLASATRTEAAGPAEVQVAGDATVTLSTTGDSGEAPDLSSVPPELQGYVQSRFEEIMARWRQQMAEFEAQVDATLQEAERLIDEQMSRIGEMFDRFGDAPSRPSPPPPDRPGQRTPPGAPSPGEPSPPAPPTDITLGFDISASGRLDPGRAIRLQGGVASDRGGRSDFEVRSRSDVAGVLVDGSWRAAAGAGSVLDTVLARADGAPAVLRAAVDAELVGETELDGAPVRRYRFAVDPGRIGRIAAAAARAEPGQWTAEAWIDDDDLLRRLDVRAAGRFDPTGVAGWAMDLSLRLSGFGSAARLLVDRPPAGATVDGTASTSVFGPFMPALTSSLRATATATAD